MECGTASLTVYFEGPYWVGVYQREWDGLLEVSRTVFGGEPKDPEIYQWLLQGWRGLRFSPPVEAGKVKKAHTQMMKPVQNPKRRQREARAIHTGIGTKAQQALQLQREQSKAQRRQDVRQCEVQEKERKFQMRQQKKKEKHRGH